VALDSPLDTLQRLHRLFAVTGQHVEAQLRVKHVGLQFVKRQHGDRLLPQLIQALLAAFAGRFENVDDRFSDGGAPGQG